METLSIIVVNMLLYLLWPLSFLFLHSACPYIFLLLLGQCFHIFNIHIINQVLLKLQLFLDAHYAFKPRHYCGFSLLLVVKDAIPLTSAVTFVFTIFSIVLSDLGQNVYCNSAVRKYIFHKSCRFESDKTVCIRYKLGTHFYNPNWNFTTSLCCSSFKLVLIAKNNRRVMAFFNTKHHAVYVYSCICCVFSY